MTVFGQREYFKMKKMKKLIGIFLICFSAFQIQAQDVKGSADQVKAYLCKTWEINYSMAEGTKVSRAPGGKNLIYTFNPNGTVYFYDHSKTRITQDWSYDEHNGVVLISENGKANTRVVSLSKDELAMMINPDNTASDNAMAIKVFFKIKK